MALIVALPLLAGLSGPSVVIAQSPSLPASPASSPVIAGGPDAGLDIAAVRQVFIDDGVAFVDSTGTTLLAGTRGAPLTLQLDMLVTLVEQADARNGRAGVDLDEVARGLPTDLPASAVLAAYALSVKTPGADLARQALAGQDLRRPQEVTFPTLVHLLFVADAVHLVGGWEAAPVTSAEPLATPVAMTATIAAQPQAMLAFTPCSSFRDVVFGSVDKVFDALHIPAGRVGKTGSSFLDALLQGLTNVVVAGLNIVVSGVRTIIVNGAKILFKDLLDEVARIASVATLVGTVMNTIQPQTLHLVPAALVTRKGVTPELVTDRVVLTVQTGGPSEWPSLLNDCARLSTGHDLPPLKPIGSPVEWTVSEQGGADLAHPSSTPPMDRVLVDVPGADAQAVMTLVTGQETPDRAKGRQTSGVVDVHATVRMKSIEDLQATLGAAMRDALAGVVPLPAPITKFLTGLLGGSGTELGGLTRYLELRARVPVVVEYHATANELRYHLEGIIDIRPTQQIAVVVDATSCTGPKGPWTGTVHTSHPPEGLDDPPSDHMIPIEWTFNRAGKAVLTIGPTTDITFGKRHTSIVRATLRLDRKGTSTITLTSLTGEEDGTTTYPLTDRFDAVGVATELLPGCQ